MSILGGLPYSNTPTEEQREAALKRTEDHLAEIQAIVRRMCLPPEAFKVAADLYRDAIAGIMFKAERDGVVARSKKMSELIKLESNAGNLQVPAYVDLPDYLPMDLLAHANDPSALFMQELQRLSDDELDSRLAIARARADLKSVPDPLKLSDIDSMKK